MKCSFGTGIVLSMLHPYGIVSTVDKLEATGKEAVGRTHHDDQYCIMHFPA